VAQGDGSRRLYVYYRVAAADAPRVIAAAQVMQQWLRTKHPALQAALLRRPRPGGASGGKPGSTSHGARDSTPDGPSDRTRDGAPDVALNGAPDKIPDDTVTLMEVYAMPDADAPEGISEALQAQIEAAAAAALTPLGAQARHVEVFVACEHAEPGEQGQHVTA
jgi:hypothetical protein